MAGICVSIMTVFVFHVTERVGRAGRDAVDPPVLGDHARRGKPLTQERRHGLLELIVPPKPGQRGRGRPVVMRGHCTLKIDGMCRGVKGLREGQFTSHDSRFTIHVSRLTVSLSRDLMAE